MKVPSKYYWLTTPVAGTPPPLATAQLTNPNIAGFRWRQDHATIQTAETTYDWSALDAALAACVTNGKLLGLSVDCGLGAASWVYDTVETFNFDPANITEGEMPNIFDPLYAPIILDFIATMGAIYNAHPNVSYVVATGFQQQYAGTLAVTVDEEDRFTIMAQAGGYADLAEGWRDIGEAIIGAFVTAFPDTAVLYTSATPYPSDDGTAEESFRDWIPATYPGRAGWMRQDLRAASGPWTAGTDVDYPHGFQAAAAGSNLEGIYGTGNVPVPDPVPPQIMIDLINNGLSEGAQFLELYPFDLNLAANQSTFATYASYLHSYVAYIAPGGVFAPPAPIGVPVPPAVVIPTTVDRLVRCRTGTHARNIILGHRRPGTPTTVPVPPGPVGNLYVTTPHTISSGVATATWLSPFGSVATDLSYRAFLTGGTGLISIVSQVVDEVLGRTLVTASITNLAPGQLLTLNVSAIDTLSNLEGPPSVFTFLSDRSTALSLSLKAPPTGVFALVDAVEGVIEGDISTRDWLGFAYVTGGTLPTTWAALNPMSANSFNWSQTDALIAACASGSKRAGISVSMGIKSPSWLFGAGGVSGFNVNGPNSGAIPLPWDQNYLQALKAFVAQFAARYDEQTELAYVTIGGMGQLLETMLVQDALDYTNLDASAVAAGYPNLLSAWQETSADILDFWQKSLPRTMVYLALELPVPSINGGMTGIDDFVQNAIPTYENRVGLMTLQLDGLTAAGGDLSLNSIIQDATTTPRAYRFLRPSSEPACDPAQDPTSYDPETGLQAAANAGINLGVQMEEFYEEDILNVDDNYPTHFADFKTDLEANTV